MRAWLMYTKDTGGPTDDTGYGDRLGGRYGYDTDVPNRKRVAEGDVVVLRNADSALGVGFIRRIRFRDLEVETERCPVCETKQLATGGRCANGHPFDEPRISIEPMREFAADYEGTFVAATLVPLDALLRLCVAKATRNAMRELDLDRLMTLLREHGIAPVFTKI